jgi:hypothetical protein
MGRLYVVQFDGGIYGQASGLQLRLQVIGSSTTLDQTVTPPPGNTFTPAAVVFQHYQFFFTADSTRTTLRFTYIVAENSA